ncbi:hypothetical protein FRC17_010467 [Serendipita sp. 399]|nr:hypothetical protein FRC17_010467 [Serendipita sp. 399]
MPTLKAPQPSVRKLEDQVHTIGQASTGSTHRGRGGGLGFVMTTERTTVKNWNLATRPLLKPIKFVRAAQRLFEADPEELLQAHQIPPHPSDQLDPQTERLAEVYEGEEPTRPATPSPQETEAELEVVQSNSVTLTQEEGTITEAMEIHHEITVTATVPARALFDASPGPIQSQIDTEDQEMQILIPHTETKIDKLFFVDATGQVSNVEAPIFERIDGNILGEDAEPDEIILVPSPATRRPASISSQHSAEAPAVIMTAGMASKETPSSPITMDNLSLDFSRKKGSSGNKSLLSFSVARSGRSTKVPRRARKETKRKRRDETWTNHLGNVFGFKDGREGLRKGDSDLDVGSDGEDDEGLEAALDHGMDVDEDLDEEAMARFAREMNKPQQSMQDVEIEVALRNGEFDSGSDDDDDDDDEEDEGLTEEDEEAMELNADLAILLAEDDEDWSSDDGEGEEDLTPKASFAARLQRVRERTPGPSKKRGVDRTWADRDEEFLDEIQDILDQNPELFHKGNRKVRNALFKAIQDGEADFAFSTATSTYYGSKGEMEKDRADYLAEQWQRDRNKKAEYKRLRELQRAEQGGLGSGKVKGKKRESSSSGTIDFEEVEEQMRSLISNVGQQPGAPKSFTIPVLLDKPTRVRVHALANAFGLKSSSSGGGKNAQHKCMTISKRSNSGRKPINERAIANALGRRWSKEGGVGQLKGIREGEIVGHKAAKISEDNIGYRLLARMGWSEGDKIGLEGGLEAPVIAVMKKSKLGLGAGRPMT